MHASVEQRTEPRFPVAQSGRRIVLATNVAETSPTVPGIKCDRSRTARISRYSYRTKVQRRLPIELIHRLPPTSV